MESGDVSERSEAGLGVAACRRPAGQAPADSARARGGNTPSVLCSMSSRCAQGEPERRRRRRAAVGCGVEELLHSRKKRENKAASARRPGGYGAVALSSLLGCACGVPAEHWAGLPGVVVMGPLPAWALGGCTTGLGPGQAAATYVMSPAGLFTAAIVAGRTCHVWLTGIPAWRLHPQLVVATKTKCRT
jgi:hypothetical protein